MNEQTAAYEECPVLNVADVVELEQRIAADGTPLSQLMRNAGKAVADTVRELAPDPCRITIFAGAGNNGGDGWVAAEFLEAAGYAVEVLCPCAPEAIEAQPAHDAAARAREASHGDLYVTDRPNNGQVTAAIRSAEVLVDALLGTGFTGLQVRPGIAGWIDRANSARSAGALRIVAVDVPSGYSAQTGSCADPCMRADATVTMMVMKPGLLSPEGRLAYGDISVAQICDLAPYHDFIESVRVRAR